jgi:hypothetical protein
MTIRWTTAFLDCAPDRFEQRLEFWREITTSTLSERRGGAGEFVTLIPPNGDAYLRAQRTSETLGGLHLDLHTPNIHELVDRAASLGATIVADRGYQVLESPGGFIFCVVSWHGEAMRPRPTTNANALVDQVCLDIPFHEYDSECTFWSSLTNWEIHKSMRAEFSVLNCPPDIPLRFLLQRLESSDNRTKVTAHLDVACGPGVSTFVNQHSSCGATVIAEQPLWATLVDPAGFPYCLTRRDPHPGTL